MDTLWSGSADCGHPDVPPTRMCPCSLPCQSPLRPPAPPPRARPAAEPCPWRCPASRSALPRSPRLRRPWPPTTRRSWHASTTPGSCAWSTGPSSAPSRRSPCGGRSRGRRVSRVRKARPGRRDPLARRAPPGPRDRPARSVPWVLLALLVLPVPLVRRAQQDQSGPWALPVRLARRAPLGLRVPPEWPGPPVPRGLPGPLVPLARPAPLVLRARPGLLDRAALRELPALLPNPCSRCAATG